jgi:hypothetical protein
VDPVAQGLAVHAADPGRRAATIPSRTAANDNSRRLWFASFGRFARLRSASAE